MELTALSVPNVHRDIEKRKLSKIMLLALRRKEVSVSWKDTSLPHMLGYGSALFVFEQLYTYPSDLLKTRLQIDTRPNTILSREIGHLYRHIVKNEGHLGLYRGFGFSTVSGIPPQLAYLVSYNWSKEKVEQFGGSRCKDLGLAPLIAGALSGGAMSLLWVPHHIIVQRIQIHSGLPPGWDSAGNYFVQRWAVPSGGASRGAWTVLKQIVREDGICGLWRGIGAHLCSSVLHTGTWWASYERSKVALSASAPEHFRGVPVHLAAGVAAGALTAAITNPLDIVKVRIQTQVAAEANPWSVLTRMVRAEGPAALGKGLLPRLWVGVPMSAASSVLYELIMSLSRRTSDSDQPERASGSGSVTL